MKTAIIHDWLVSSIGGGEKVLEEIHRLFPSPIFTLLKDKKKLQNSYFEHLQIVSSFIQKLPFATQLYRNYLPFFPFAIENFSLSEFDLLISSSHCVAKGIKLEPHQIHLCYCHTPMRYAWDLMDAYLTQAGLNNTLKGFFAKKILEHLRTWDLKSSKRVTHFAANSQYIAKRIEICYQRKAEVIYPPVDTSLFTLEEKKEDYYVTASRLVQNKRVDLIVETFWNFPNKKLFVIGDGPQKQQLEKNAPPNVTFLGEQSPEDLKQYLQKAKAFLFAAVEDFGMAPVEAMATGTPVIALGEGGAKETVIPNLSGILYKEQTSQNLAKAIEYFETIHIDPKACHEHAQQFSKEKFREKFQKFVLVNKENFYLNRLKT